MPDFEIHLRAAGCGLRLRRAPATARLYIERETRTKEKKAHADCNVLLSRTQLPTRATPTHHYV